MPYTPIPAIYYIRNVVNQKVYVGSAASVYSRFSRHRNELNRGVHRSKHLQQEWHQFGEDSFEFAILEVVEDIHQLVDREQQWMNMYDCHKREFGYNSNSVAKNNCSSIRLLKASAV